VGSEYVIAHWFALWLDVWSEAICAVEGGQSEQSDRRRMTYCQTRIFTHSLLVQESLELGSEYAIGT
jgi:hypothetical protein